MGPVCTPGNVTVPCESSAWDFGGQALYLKPSFGAPFAGVTRVANATSGFDYPYFNKNNDWSWGFQLEGSFHFGTGNDIDLNWYHLSNSKNTQYRG